MRTTKVYSITMPPDLARQAERLAKKENRILSESFDMREFVRPIAPTPPALRAMQRAARRKGTDKLTMAQIQREVRAVRNQHDKKKTKRPAK